MNIRHQIGIAFLALLLLVGCEKDSFIGDNESLTKTGGPLSLDIRRGSTPEFIASVEAALVDSSGIELDWSEEDLKPFSRGRKTLVVPVKNSTDYVIFYKEKGKTLYKYLHPLSDNDEGEIFEERMFQVVNDSEELASIGKFASQAGEKIARLDTRTKDTPCDCYGDPFEWLRQAWNNFTAWISGNSGCGCPGESNGFDTSSDGRYRGSSANWYSSRGPTGWTVYGDYSNIGNDNLGISYNDGGGSYYNNQGELFNIFNNIALGVLPNLSAGSDKGVWLREHTSVLIQIDAYFQDFGGYTAEAKQAADKYYELMRYDSQFAGENINLIDFQPEEFLATAILYEVYKSEVGNNPVNPYQWQLAMEVFREELVPLGLEFIPVVGDFIGSYNDFQSGDYFMGCAGLILAVVPGNELFKVIDDAPTIVKGWKAVKKVFVLWNKLFTSTGGQKILNKLPQSWKDLPGSKLANNEKGLYWEKASNYHFRIMEENPFSQWPTQQVKYGKFHKGNSYIDINGNPVSGNSAEAHIPLDDITDNFLDNFFN